MKPGLRDRKREATRTSIWQSAMRLFAERGYDSVTVEDIAEICDLSPRTFFRYFGSKEDVLFAGGEARRTMLMYILEVQPPDATPFEAIAGASRMVAAHYLPDRDLLLARAQIVETAPSLRSRNAGLPRQWDRDVIDLLRSSGRAEGMSDLELGLAVGASMTALRVAIEVWIASDGDLIDLIEAAFARLATGLAVKAAGSGRLRASG